MIRIDLLLFGYRVIEIEKTDIKAAVKLLFKNNINAKIKNHSLIVSERKYKEISKLLATRVKFKASELLGLPGFLYKNRKRYGVFCALLFTLIVFVLTSDKIWDVRIEGENIRFEDEILKELAECGFSSGKSFKSMDFSKVEVMLLEKSEYVAWANIYRRGNVAYVTVRNKISHEEKEEKLGYSNVVAACDAVIEEITVNKGVAMVKPGESVKAGDLLISGILPAESGGGFCYAEGIIIGRITDSIEVVAENERSVKIPEKTKISEINVNFFKFSAKIFKSYGKKEKDYDIIERKVSPTLFGKRLPIYFDLKYREFFRVERVLISESEMAETALQKMREALESRLENATLLKIRSEGGFSDSGYTLRTYFVLSENIGRDLPFEVEE